MKKIKVGPAVKGDVGFQHGIEVDVSDEFSNWMKGGCRAPMNESLRLEMKEIQKKINASRDVPVWNI
jgi:hypothetical protein